MEDEQLDHLSRGEEELEKVDECSGDASAEKEEQAGENREATSELQTDVEEVKPEVGQTPEESCDQDASSEVDTESRQEEAEKILRFAHDFPESLFELLCTLQEGRRLNDQRCSFMLDTTIRRRRCHSEPNTRRPANRVVFSSMTSLQKEEFLDLVATAQARRLDDQRAKLEKSPTIKPKSRSFRGSLRQLSLVRRPEKPPEVPKEDLYNMILTTQAQGRLEDQRSRAPGPMDDEDFFSLLLRVQGGRMEEQRTELPCLLQT
ncbi:G-protein-signaling modulator 2 isoform 1-T4 [Synchiropus picturatus]